MWTTASTHFRQRYLTKSCHWCPTWPHSKDLQKKSAIQYTVFWYLFTWSLVGTSIPAIMPLNSKYIAVHRERVEPFHCIIQNNPNFCQHRNAQCEKISKDGLQSYSQVRHSARMLKKKVFTVTSLCIKSTCRPAGRMGRPDLRQVPWQGVVVEDNQVTVELVRQEAVPVAHAGTRWNDAAHRQRVACKWPGGGEGGGQGNGAPSSRKTMMPIVWAQCDTVTIVLGYTARRLSDLNLSVSHFCSQAFRSYILLSVRSG